MDLDLMKLLLLLLLGQLKCCASMHLADPMNCSHGAVRLVNGSNIYEGRVEICLHGIWKTVCDDVWGNSDASVVCAQLGYQRDGAMAFTQAHFGQGSGLILEEIFCYGHEMMLTACYYLDEDDGYCHHSEDAGIRCLPCPTDGAIRLPDRTDYQRNIIRSLVEVCINGTWSVLCISNFYNIHWNSVEASITCKQLGYSKYESVALLLIYRIDLRAHLANISCTGSERRLIDCSHNYTDQPINCWIAAAVECRTTLLCRENELRVLSGNTVNEGRVEICLNETWGTVCANNWDQLDSTVVCKQLGYSDKGAQVKQVDRLGRGPIHLKNVQCIGNESNLYDCQHDIHASTVNCTHNAGVSCCFDMLSTPLNFQATVDETNNCTLSWQTPNVIKRQGTLFYYLINCTVWSAEDDFITAYTNDTDQSLELRPYTSYTCCVSGVNEVRIGIPACQSFITYESVPTAPPTNIKVHPFNTTSAFLSWRPPLAKHRNGITREYIVELVKLNTTIMFQYTTQDPYLLINNLEPDKVYMSRIAAITVGRGPYSESVITTTHLLTDNDHISISENDHCELFSIKVVSAMAGTSGFLLLIVVVSSILLVVLCCHSKLCKSRKENTRCAVQSPVYEEIDITATDFSNNISAATVTVKQKQYSQPPSILPAIPPNDHISETYHGHQDEHFTPAVRTNIAQLTNEESTYQPLLPLRAAHQKSISTEYQSLRQLTKEQLHDLPPPIPPKPKTYS